VRPVAVLKMEDEAGLDAKLMAVPVDALTQAYAEIKTKKDLDPTLVNNIEHFFKNYKTAEPGKWVKIHGWEDVDAAHDEITQSVARMKSHSD
jgi:inorganic pyrophosphatase